MPNTEKKPYIIYTNSTEVTLLNLLKETNNLYNSFYSVNDYLILLEVINVLKTVNDKDGTINALNQVLDNMSNDSDQASSTILWDNTRNEQLAEEGSDYQKFIEDIKTIMNLPYSDEEGLQDIVKYDRYDRNQLTKVITSINKSITFINDNCGDFDGIVDGNLAKINKIATDNPTLATKYANEITEVQDPSNKHFSVYEEDINSIMNKIKAIVNCEIVTEESTTPVENPLYIITVGYKDLPQNRIESYIQTINSLYNQLYDESIFEAQYVYVDLINNLINNHEEGANKPTELETIKSNSSLYSQASDDVKGKVDELINQYTQEHYDDEYVYTDADKNRSAALVSSANNKLAQVRNSNNATRNKIQSYMNKIETAQAEYAEENGGSSYQPQEEIDTTPGKDSNYEYVTPASDIYSKELPEIESVVATPSSVSLEEGGQAISISLTYIPPVHKSITINGHSNDSNIATVDWTETNVVITSHNVGNTSITMDINGFTLEIPVTVIAKPSINYVYFGLENPISNNTLNTSLEGMEEHYYMTEIIGQRTIPQTSYIVLPLEWFRYTQIQNNSHNDMDRADFNKKVTYNEIEYVVADLTYDEPWSASTIYINELLEPVDPIISDDEEPVKPSNYTWYLGETSETTITESMFNQSEVKPESITWNTANGDIYQVMVIPESWGKPSAIVDGEEYNGWTWPDTYLTVPPNYVGISARGATKVITLTWPSI